MTRAITAINEPELAVLVRSYHDVTERLMRSHDLLQREVCRLRDELHEKNQQLLRQERLAALGEMAAGVAHEIRNPLGGIGLYASLLERELADRPALAEWVRHVRTGVATMDGVVGDILAFAGGHPPRTEPVRAEDLTETLIGQASPRARTLDVELTLACEPGGSMLNCDPLQIERALLNLVFNALDAAGPGGLVRVAGRKCHDTGTQFLFVVDDNGPGIEPGMLHRIFNPFFTTKASGTGLGLAIVHRVAEAHGGSVTAGNRAEGGARFVLSLPLWTEEAPAGPDKENY